MSVKCIPPHTPFLYGKTGLCRGVPIFLNFAPKHRLWVLVTTASVLTCTHNLCFKQNKEKYKKFATEIFNFFQFLHDLKIIAVICMVVFS